MDERVTVDLVDRNAAESERERGLEERENQRKKRAGWRRRGVRRASAPLRGPNPTFLACPHLVPVAPAAPSHWALAHGWRDGAGCVFLFPSYLRPDPVSVCSTMAGWSAVQI